jgi:hypothetical protein
MSELESISGTGKRMDVLQKNIWGLRIARVGKQLLLRQSHLFSSITPKKNNAPKPAVKIR